MRIVDIRQRTFALGGAQANAAISFETMTASAVAIVTDVMRDGRPVVGFGLDSAGRYAHGNLAIERFAARLRAAKTDDLLDDTERNLDPDKAWSAMMRNEKPGGHGERAGAVGLLDMAVWDIVAKLEDKPLWSVLAGRDGRDVAPPRRVPTYATGGYYNPGDDAGALRAEIKSIRERGHTHVKIKAGGVPVADRKRIETAIEILGGGDRLAVDLNGTFDLTQADEFVAAVEPYGLWWIEEPVDPLDFELQAELCRRYRTPFASGENLFSLADARNLIRYGGLRPQADVLQFDVALAYGIAEYRRIVAMIEAQGWSRRRCFPHAGHLLALHVVGGLGLGGHEISADPRSLFGVYPEGCTVEEGRVSLPDAPGLGFEATPLLYAAVSPLVG